jgi:tetratricopeptide (TPR) repeat protein
MKIAGGFLIAALVGSALIPASAATKKERIDEAIRLHDQNDFDGAIVIYRAVLKDYPHDPTAVYEMSFSWVSSNKNLEELTNFIEAELASGVEQHPGLPPILGKVYDELGQYTKGEAAIRRGLVAAPDNANFHYNLGVNLRLQKRLPEAADAFLEALKRKGDYASAWFGLGLAEKEMKRPERAFFAFARGVALEPESDRCRQWAETLPSLLFARVTTKTVTDATKLPRSEVTVSIPPPATPEGHQIADEKAENAPPPDVATLEALGAGIGGAARNLEAWEKKSNAEFFPHAIQTLTKIYSEVPAIRDDPFWTVVLPWFVGADAAGHTDALGYVLLHSAGDREAAAWVGQHAKQVQAYRDWMATKP